MILCEMCDQAVHIHCLKPKLSQVPKESWYCNSCVKCLMCNKKLQPVLAGGRHDSLRWLGTDRVCEKCAQTMDERADQIQDDENTCGKCMKQYEGEFVECDKCE